MASALVASLVLGTAACGPAATPSPSIGSPTAASPTAMLSTPGPLATAPGPTAPPGTLALPTAFAVELAPGTYFSSPPFDVPFTFEVSQPGWVAGHLVDEFFDLQWYDGDPVAGLPLRMVGFGHPATFRGGAGDVPASELSPREAVDLLADRDPLVATNIRDLEILGAEAARIDLRTNLMSAPLFGGDAGTFGLAHERELRMVVFEIEGAGLLVFIVETPSGELADAWEEASAILSSVEPLPWRSRS